MKPRGTPPAIRYAGFIPIVAGLLLALGHLSFWLLLPEQESKREAEETLAVATGLTWLGAHLLMAPAFAFIYSQQYRYAGTIGGVGVALTVGGTLGIAATVFLIFPEIVGLDTDTVHEARVALTLQALGELGATSFIAGLIFFGIATEMAGVFPRLSGLLLLLGGAIAPFGFVVDGLLALAAVLTAAGLILLGAMLVLDRRRRTAVSMSRRPGSETISSFWGVRSPDR